MLRHVEIIHFNNILFLDFEKKSLVFFVFYKSFRNGKYHGYGLYFDYEEKSMYTMEYNNGNFIDSERLGFSEEATQNSDQLRNYLDLFSPEIRINTTSNQPMNNPLGIKTSKKNK